MKGTMWFFHNSIYAQKWQPAIISSLIDITQRKKDTLQEYVDQFMKVGVALGGTNDGLKCWMLKKGLILDWMFWEKIGLKGASGLNNLMNMAQTYINYEIELSVVVCRGWQETGNMKPLTQLFARKI